jgi:putative transposase
MPKEIFQQIADEYEFGIDTTEVMEDHAHIFVEAPPRYSPAQIVHIMKSISAREVFKKYPKLRRQLWAHELRNDGYFARSVGDKVTADIIRNYIEYQTRQDDASRLKMFK